MAMIDEIKKFERSVDRTYDLTVLIPTWNNLPYLQNCIDGLRNNSSKNLQIIVFVNEGKDNTIQWLEKQNDLDFLHCRENIGICYSMNACRSLFKSDYIVYMNDDMFPLPGWDKELWNAIVDLNTRAFMLSSTLIEPFDTGNISVQVQDYGRDLENFRKDELIQNAHLHTTPDWSGSTWPPNVIHREVWDLIGGFSVEFSPGMYSDPDISKKLYDAGVRIFKGVGSSLVYHFGSKSTGRIRKNSGRKTFLRKWGISARFFTTNFLNMGRKYSILKDFNITTFQKFLNRIKSIFSA